MPEAEPAVHEPAAGSASPKIAGSAPSGSSTSASRTSTQPTPGPRAKATETLEDWREGHLRYFHDEAARLGLAFTEDSVVFFEHFRLLSVFGRADA